MARGHLVFALSVLPSFRHSVLPSYQKSVIGKRFLPMGHFQLFSMILKFSMGPFLSFYTDFDGPFSKLMGLWRMAPCLPNHWKIVFSTPTSLHGFEWNLAGMLHNKSRSACEEIIHVRQILAELWPLTLRSFTHFSLSSQLLLHPCMDLNETRQGCCTTSLEVHVGR